MFGRRASRLAPPRLCPWRLATAVRGLASCPLAAPRGRTPSPCAPGRALCAVSSPAAHHLSRAKKTITVKGEEYKAGEPPQAFAIASLFILWLPTSSLVNPEKSLRLSDPGCNGLCDPIQPAQKLFVPLCVKTSHPSPSAAGSPGRTPSFWRDNAAPSASRPRPSLANNPTQRKQASKRNRRLDACFS